MKNIPLTKPYIPKTVFKNLEKMIKKGFLTEGEYTYKFENLIKKIIKCKYCISFTSATTALEALLKSLNFKKGHEIIAPNFSFPATITPIIQNGINVRLIDVDRDDFNISQTDLKKNINKKTKAIIPVSVFGNSIDYESVNKIIKNKSIFLIEDSAASLGTSYKNRNVGNISDFSIFSFHPRKSITSGEGGVLTTNNKIIATWLKKYKSFGFNKNKNSHFEIVGTNLKFSNINAIFALSQLEILDKILHKKKKIALRYIYKLSRNKNIKFQKITSNSTHSYQTFCIIVENRDFLINKLREKGIETQIGYYALSEQNAFKNCKNISYSSNLENSIFLSKHSLALPLYYKMSKSEQDIVVKAINQMT